MVFITMEYFKLLPYNMNVSFSVIKHNFRKRSVVY